MSPVVRISLSEYPWGMFIPSHNSHRKWRFFLSLNSSDTNKIWGSGCQTNAPSLYVKSYRIKRFGRFEGGWHFIGKVFVTLWTNVKYLSVQFFPLTSPLCKIKWHLSISNIFHLQCDKCFTRNTESSDKKLLKFTKLWRRQEEGCFWTVESVLYRPIEWSIARGSYATSTMRG